ncbi:MAG: hypothetical protein Q7J60_18450, partial [Bradyrhizobium sp.]|nr:hypothetical protein [Bradyrhizobium sp.]
MVRIRIDQQRLQRREEKPRRIVRASLSRPVAAKLGAQSFQHRRRPGNLGSAYFQPLELGQQAAARRRRQPLQELLDLVRQCHVRSGFSRAIK